MRNRSVAVAASLGLAVLLAGCAAGDPEPADEPTTAPSAPAGGDADGGGPGAADCVVGEWSADVDDLAAQLLDFFTGNGIPATGTDAEGSIVLGIDGAGGASVRQDVSIQVDANLNGLPLTIIQRHSGEGEGSWSVDEDSLEFPEWNAGTLLVEQDVTLDGQTFDLPIELPETQYGTPLHVASCDDATMVTEAEGSPFTTTWVRT